MKKLLLMIIMAGIVAVGIYGVRQFEQPKLDQANGQQTFLKQQVDELQDKLAAANKAAEVKTDGWKQYCDPQASLCFKFPQDWNLEGGSVDPAKHVSTTVTSADKSIVVRYADPLLKDSAPSSWHIVKMADIAVGASALEVVGAYPVSFGAYQPAWTVLSRNKTTDMVESKIGVFPANPHFDYDKTSPLSMVVSGPAFQSAAQAEAWYGSAEGKTAQAIAASLSKK